MTKCKCKHRKVHPDELMAEYCLNCGLIWLNDFTGGFRVTQRYHQTPSPLEGVWVGHTLVKGPSQLVQALRVRA